MIFWFVRSLAIIFFLSGVILNILKPFIFIHLYRNKDSHADDFTWQKSWSVLINASYQVVINIQQLMILLFYYRLDQRSNFRRHRRNEENRYSMQTVSQYEPSSDSEYGQEDHDKLTIFDTQAQDNYSNTDSYSKTSRQGGQTMLSAMTNSQYNELVMRTQQSLLPEIDQQS